MAPLFEKRYAPDAPLLSLHVPKCAGQSIGWVLNEWFGARFVRHYYDEVGGNVPEVLALAPGSVVHGHFSRWKGTAVEAFYPQASQFISFVRDPFDIFVSQYFYLKQRSSEWIDKPQIGASLRLELERAIQDRDNVLFDFLPTRTVGQRLKDYIRTRFLFVGLFEDFQRSVDWLADVLMKPRVSVPHMNSSKYDEEIPDMRSLFRSRFSDEYEFYDLVRAAHSMRNRC